MKIVDISLEMSLETRDISIATVNIMAPKIGDKWVLLYLTGDRPPKSRVPRNQVQEPLDFYSKNSKECSNDM